MAAQEMKKLYELGPRNLVSVVRELGPGFLKVIDVIDEDVFGVQGVFVERLELCDDHEC